MRGLIEKYIGSTAFRGGFEHPPVSLRTDAVKSRTDLKALRDARFSSAKPGRDATKEVYVVKKKVVASWDEDLQRGWILKDPREDAGVRKWLGR
jgi:hypothetical protein